MSLDIDPIVERAETVEEWRGVQQGDNEDRAWDRQRAILFNDITHAPTTRHLLFSTRQEIAKYLHQQGWRREERPEDTNSY